MIKTGNVNKVLYKNYLQKGEEYFLAMNRDVLKSKARQLLSVLQLKNRAEYEEKLTTENGALAALKSTERFYGWVKELLSA